MRKNNDQGFTFVEIMLVLIATALIVFVGYYIYNTQSVTNKTLAVSPPTSQNTSNTKSNQKYLVIKEWGVKLPLNSIDTGAYYTPPVSEQLAQYVAVFDAGIDKLNNQNGVNCKDSQYPLMIITRLKTSDVATTTDMNSPNFITETNASMYKTFNWDKQNSYASRTSSQSAPQCSDINPSGDYKADPTVDASYATVKKALSLSFNKMQAE